MKCLRPPSECGRCPRLTALRANVRLRHPYYHAAPVPAWGRRDARLVIVGLAPGMHGANRTGRPFTGDASGDFLFRALAEHGFASSRDAQTARLVNVRITNAVKCVPPGNRPLAAEISACRRYLVADLEPLRARRNRSNRVVLCLGRVAHDAVGKALDVQLPAFAHGAVVRITRALWIVDTYHPSRLNTNTGRLTEAMLRKVVGTARSLLSGAVA